MPSTAQPKADNVALTRDVNSLKDERESLRTLLLNLTEEKKANPEENFDYLNENKEACLSFCEAQKEKEESEAANPDAPTSQSTNNPAADDIKEPRTPAV
uniref:Uncharacterized protein n=1 Tax=Cannabis sativa TaxID=3483 RepID=A0A803NJH3_CANSA